MKPVECIAKKILFRLGFIFVVFIGVGNGYCEHSIVSSVVHYCYRFFWCISTCMINMSCVKLYNVFFTYFVLPRIKSRLLDKLTKFIENTQTIAKGL